MKNKSDIFDVVADDEPATRRSCAPARSSATRREASTSSSPLAGRGGLGRKPSRGEDGRARRNPRVRCAAPEAPRASASVRPAPHPGPASQSAAALPASWMAMRRRSSDPMTLDLFLLQLFTGLALGSIYVLLALGLSLIFGMLTVVNFAHGAVLHARRLCRRLRARAVRQLLALPRRRAAVRRRPRAAGRALPGAPALRARHRLPAAAHLRARPTSSSTACASSFGTEGIPFAGARRAAAARSTSASVLLPAYRLFLIGVTALVLLALWFFLEKTPYGLIIRAGARDPEIVRVLGVDVARVWLIVFGLGIALAGLAGVLAAPLQRRHSRDGHPDPGRRLRRHGGRRHGLAPGRRGRRPARRRRRELHLAVYCPQIATLSIFILMALVLICPSAGLLRPRRGARADGRRRAGRGRDGVAARAAPLIRLIARHRVLAAVIFLAVFPLAGAVQGAGGEHPDLRAVRARLQPDLRLSRHAVLRPCGAVRARRLWLRHRRSCISACRGSSACRSASSPPASPRW